LLLFLCDSAWGRLLDTGRSAFGGGDLGRLHLGSMELAIFFLEQVVADVEERGQWLHGGDRGDRLTKLRVQATEIDRSSGTG
jgi:hypothetical protein